MYTSRNWIFTGIIITVVMIMVVMMMITMEIEVGQGNSGKVLAFIRVILMVGMM